MQKRYGWCCSDLRRNARNRTGPARTGGRAPDHGPPAPHDPAEHGAVPRDRRSYGLARYTAGAVAARTGDEMSGPALLLAGLAATGSAVTASTLLAAVTVAAAAGGPLLGALLDRSARPGRLLAGALAGYALALLVILLCLGRAPIGPTLAVAVLAGLLGPAVAGGWTSRLPGVVRADRLDRANTLDAMTFNAAGLLGPLLAGATALYAGAGTAVVVSAALVATAVPAALHLTGPRPRTLPSAAPHPSAASHPSASASAGAKDPVPPAPADAPSGPLPAPVREEAGTGPEAPPRPSVHTELAAGFRAIAETGPLSRATASSVLSCAGQGAFLVCAPFLGAQVLGDPGHGTLLLAAVAASALAANALTARRRTPPRPETVLAASTALLAAALALMATYHPVAVVAGAVLLGAGEGPQLTALFAIRHREAPERLRARIFTTGASLKITGFAVGAAAAGPLAAHSPAIALTAAAIVQLLAVLPLCGGGRRRDGRIGATRPRYDTCDQHPAREATMLHTDDFADTGWVTVRVAGDRELTVSFDTTPGTGPGSPSAQTLDALLPRVRDLLADFEAVGRTAVDHLWQWGAEPSDTDDDRAEFIATMHPAELVVREDGGFALHYTETGGRMLDGYWPAVHFTADRTPTDVTVEC